MNATTPNYGGFPKCNFWKHFFLKKICHNFSEYYFTLFICFVENNQYLDVESNYLIADSYPKWLDLRLTTSMTKKKKCFFLYYNQIFLILQLNHEPYSTDKDLNDINCLKNQIYL